MPTESEILAYYAARANEYEKVYAKPERQRDLRDLQQRVPAYLAGRRVLEVACGTGYWTRLIAPAATAITGVDLSPEVLAVAKTHQPASTPATFVIGDALALDDIPGTFDAAFVGFWWSHVPRQDLHRFLTGLHRRLAPRSLVLIVDNRYVPGSNSPVTSTDDEQNTYQRRQLESGAEYDVIKNFPEPAEVQHAIAAAGGSGIVVRELQYYWYSAYKVSA
jgi:SAM-dependent methyltransferase